ncbi:hypothetical protein TNCV_1702931 [Trichonephila clavipes]|nr:hypothetical protein TNCV_1702931 [Trichonephila clavipes]
MNPAILNPDQVLRTTQELAFHYPNFQRHKGENFVTGSRVFSLTCLLRSLRPELTATLFHSNPRSEM